jgi:hypothetical protein
MSEGQKGEKCFRGVRCIWVSIRDQWLVAVVALIAIGVGWSQWGLSEKRVRIGAAVDISSKYFGTEITDLRNKHNKFLLQPDASDADLRDSANAFVYYLDYIAKLILSDAIELEFVAPVVRCQLATIFEKSYYSRSVNKDRLEMLPSLDQVQSLTDYHKRYKKTACS